MDKNGDNGSAMEKPVKELVLNPAVEDISSESLPVHASTYGEVNMEASIYADDVIRAGGFGTTDDINSFLPVASDSTDFEASLRNARGYEEQQQEIHRYGLGWTDPKVGNECL
uniref:Uncharacterized protein n=1 Tax=Kalanchoe fedtschenkoi TaxID=63787 RepID=A0A7N0VC73_KALFE